MCPASATRYAKLPRHGKSNGKAGVPHFCQPSAWRRVDSSLPLAELRQSEVAQRVLCDLEDDRRYRASHGTLQLACQSAFLVNALRPLMPRPSLGHMRCPAQVNARIRAHYKSKPLCIPLWQSELQTTLLWPVTCTSVGPRSGLTNSGYRRGGSTCTDTRNL